MSNWPSILEDEITQMVLALMGAKLFSVSLIITIMLAGKGDGKWLQEPYVDSAESPRQI